MYEFEMVLTSYVARMVLSVLGLGISFDVLVRQSAFFKIPKNL